MTWRFWESREQRIAREAARWHADMLEPVSEKARASFEDWRAADPAHAEVYAEFEPISGLATGLPRPARDQSRRVEYWRPAFGVAIPAVLIVGAALLLVGRGAAPLFAAVTNPGPAVRVVRLADGSVVALDHGAALSVRVDPSIRRVRLQAGRARFNIADNDTRPFVICDSIGCVQSTGGVVDVAMHTNYPDVVSLRGPVVLITKRSGSDRAVSLSPGSAADISGSTVTPASVSRRQRLWPVARAGFNKAPLATIVAAANKLGQPVIRLDGSDLGTLRVTGVLDLRDTRILAEKLAAALHLTVKVRPDEIVLTR
jgi:transmembrane sensor